MSQGMAAAASIAGFSETDIMAVAASVGSLGIEAGAGSTAMSTLISTLYKATETGKNLEEFASVANMSASEFKQAWGEDAVGAMNAFVQGLTDTERNGRSAVVILDELGITNVRQTKAILGLAQAGDLLSNSISQANNAWEQNTALQAKAGIMYATTESKMIMAQNAVNNLKIAVGDAYTPILQKVYDIQTRFANAVAKWASENPAVVRALTAFGVVVGVAVAGLSAYMVIAKVIPLINKMLAASFGTALGPIGLVVIALAALVGIVTYFATKEKEAASEVELLTATSREQYNELEKLRTEYENLTEAGKETSVEAQLLKRDIDDLTASYEANKQTLADYTVKHEQIIKSYEEQSEAQQKAYNEIDTETDKASALIAELERLTTSSDGAAGSQQRIAAIASALNEILPNLVINYDLLNGGSEEYLALLRQQADEEAKKAKYQEQIADYQNRTASRKGLKDDVDSASAQLELLKIEYAAALAAKEATLSIYTDIEGFEYYSYGNAETKKVNELSSQISTLTGNLNTATDAYEENEGAISSLESKIGYYVQAEEEAYEKTGKVKDVIAAETAEIETLTAAYNAAKKSVEGHFDLWDKAEKITAVKTGDINSALDTQINYWNKYNANLEKVSARTDEIEGLQDVIASFADGSPESIAAIAGMADAIDKGNDKALSDMVAKWQELHATQETTERYLAELETDFDRHTKAITDSLEQQIKDMNVSEEAQQAGQATIDAFIAAADDRLPDVEAAYQRIADAAYGALQPHSARVAGGSGNAGVWSMNAYAGGTTDSANAFIAGENGPELIVGAQGSTVFPASETDRIIDAYDGGSGGEPSIVYSPTITVTGGDSPELRETLAENEQSFFDRLDEWWDEKRNNEERRAFA
jgi:hypothetical protein